MQLVSKKNHIIIIFSEFILLLLASLFLLRPAISNIREKYSHNNLVSISNLDFKIPSPSLEQIKSIENMNAVDNVFPFFDTFTSICVGKNELKDSYVMIIPLQYKNVYPFVNDRLFIKGEKENDDNVLFVDYSFSKRNGVNIGSPIALLIGNKEKEYKVSGIVNNFSDFLSSSENQRDVVLLFIDIEELYSYIEKEISYSSAYIRCNDADAFKQYLTTYKPYGRMRSKDSFDSEQEYNEYVDYFEKGQYEAEILSLEFRNELNNSNTGLKFVLIFTCVSFIIILISIILVATDKTLVYNSKSLIQNGYNYVSLASKIKTLLMIVLWIGIIEITIVYFIFTFSSTDYCSISTLIPVILLAIILPLFLGLCSVFGILKIIKKKNKLFFESLLNDRDK